MKWIEIIEIRTAGNTRKKFENHLKILINEIEKKSEKRTITLYTNMMIDTDFSIHLFHDSEKVETQESPLCTRLVSILKSYGLVNHTIWIETKNESTTR